MNEAILPPAGPVTPFGNRGAVSDHYAWMIAGVPIAMVPLDSFIDSLDLSSNSITMALSVGLFASLRRQDVAAMRAAGYERVPSLWWVLLQPGYLWQRAGILGDSRRLFWCSVGAVALAIALAVGLDPSVRHAFTNDLQCADVGDDIVSMVNTIDSMKAAGLSAKSAHALTETGATGSERSCRGYVELTGGGMRTVTYTLTKENGKTTIALRVLPP
jgi:hypothetical protein